MDVLVLLIGSLITKFKTTFQNEIDQKQILLLRYILHLNLTSL